MHRPLRRVLALFRTNVGIFNCGKGSNAPPPTNFDFPDLMRQPQKVLHFHGQGDYTIGTHSCLQHIIRLIRTRRRKVTRVRRWVWRLLALAGLNMLYAAGQRFVRRRIR